MTDHGIYHGWHYEHHFATGVSYAWREGRDEISADGEDHVRAIERMIDEQPTDRELAEAEPVELEAS